MKILLLEDDPDLQVFLADKLRHQGCEVHSADTCASATALAGAGFDIYIVDRMLPDGDGQDWLERVRLEGDVTPALFLTALGSVVDKVSGLRLADDYLVKPFDFAELWARLQSIARRLDNVRTNQIALGGLSIDRVTHEVKKNGAVILLKPMEYKLLDCFLSHNGQVVTRKMLLEQVWGFHFDPATNIVETYISRLRAKIDDPGTASLIETVRGEGYRFVAQAQ
jgi:two-component system, OmpR family, response regulator